MKRTSPLDKEISRLYKLGSSCSEIPKYITTNETETMMNLYLSHKYKLDNPFQDDIIQAYKHYGRIRARYTPWMKPPIQYRWELYVYLDAKDNIIGHNSEEYAELFSENLLEMTKRTPGKKIICDLNSCVFLEKEAVTAHSEMIIYDPLLNVLEYVDSNNIPKHCARKDKNYFNWSSVRISTARLIADLLPSQPHFICNADIYDGYEWGIQSLECTSDLLISEEKIGYCLMWSHLIGDLALMFPEYSVKDIIKSIIKKSELKTVKVKYSNDYMVYLIRGYVRDVSDVIGVDFSDIDSKHAACCKLVL